jgi:hypothetical protein
MSKLTHVVKIATVLGLLALLLAMSTFTLTSSKAFAATTQASTEHSITSAKISRSVQPLCGTSVWWYEWPANVQRNVSYTYGFSWSCAGNNTQTWIIDWRDGYSSSFTCYPVPYYSSCVSGSFTGNHSYSVAGTYTVKVYNSYNSAIAAWVTITVY